MERPAVEVAVVFEREAKPNAWEDWRFRVVEVVEQQPAFGAAPRVLHDDGKFTRWLYPGFTVTLFRDEGEGYYLNATAPQPVWFVMWRRDDEDPSRAWPEMVTLSYNEAGRWLDAQERVDNAPLQPHLFEWLNAFAAEHYKPEPKRRKRPASFLPPDQRGPASPGDPGNPGDHQVRGGNGAKGAETAERKKPAH